MADSGLGASAKLGPWVPGVTWLAEAYPTEVHPERWGRLRVFRWIRPLHAGQKCVHVRLGGISGP